MKINIKEVEQILLQEEIDIKEGVVNSIFDEVLINGKKEVPNMGYLLARLNDYGNTRYISAEVDISFKPEHIFIRVLSSNNEPNTIDNFEELTDELSNSDSELIDLLIAKNSHISENVRIKIFKKNPNWHILEKLAENATTVELLDALFATEIDEVKVAILNNPLFNKSEKFLECYESCIQTFNDYNLGRINEKFLPEQLKEEYEYYKEIRYIDIRICSCMNDMDTYYTMGEDLRAEDFSYELDKLRQRRQELEDKKPKTLHP